MSQTSPQSSVLIVGAGAVGLTYGVHLSRAGAKTCYFVRAKYVEQTSQPQSLLELGFMCSPKERTFTPDLVISELEQVKAQPWDYVILTVSSTALRGGDWFERFAGALNPESLVVMLQPGVEDRQFVARYVDPSRIIQGMIGFLAYEGPLQGERDAREGLRYWLPPGSPSLLSAEGSDDVALAKLIKLLRSGGFDVKKPSMAADKQAAFLTAMMMSQIVALEVEGWSFEALRRSELMTLGLAAGKEAAKIMERHLDCRAPSPINLISPTALSLGTRVAPKLAPLPLEAFFKKHFSKVGDQTMDLMQDYIRLAKEQGASHDAIDKLTAALEQRRVD